jgi:hypothetical protein
VKFYEDEEGGTCCTHDRMRNAYKILIDKHLGDFSIGEDNIKTDLKEIRHESVDLILLVQNTGRWRALENAVMKLLII